MQCICAPNTNGTKSYDDATCQLQRCGEPSCMRLWVFSFDQTARTAAYRECCTLRRCQRLPIVRELMRNMQSIKYKPKFIGNATNRHVMSWEFEDPPKVGFKIPPEVVSEFKIPHSFPTMMEAKVVETPIESHDQRFGSSYYRYSGSRVSTLQQFPALASGLGLAFFLLLGIYLASMFGRRTRRRRANPQQHVYSYSRTPSLSSEYRGWRGKVLTVRILHSVFPAKFGKQSKRHLVTG